jgi:hypothetical protein
MVPLERATLRASRWRPLTASIVPFVIGVEALRKLVHKVKLCAENFT